MRVLLTDIYLSFSDAPGGGFASLPTATFGKRKGGIGFGLAGSELPFGSGALYPGGRGGGDFALPTGISFAVAAPRSALA